MMNREVQHILSHFDKSDFKDFDVDLWKSKYHGDTIVMYYDNMYISIEKIFEIAANKQSIKLKDLRNF